MDQLMRYREAGLGLRRDGAAKANTGYPSVLGYGAEDNIAPKVRTRT